MIDHRTLTNVESVLVCDYQNSPTAGSRGPLLMQEFHLLDTLAHFNQERIPERVVHAKGAVAFDMFTVPLTLASTAKPIGYISDRLCQ